MISKQIFPEGYGIAFFSMDLFMDEIRNIKCRRKNMSLTLIKTWMFISVL